MQHGEPLYSVETDKATLNVEAPAAGVLRRVTANPGDVVKVLSTIAVIEAETKVKAEAEFGAGLNLETRASSSPHERGAWLRLKVFR